MAKKSVRDHRQHLKRHRRLLVRLSTDAQSMKQRTLTVVVVALVVCAMLSAAESVGQEIPDEFCQWETFNASCSDRPGHVILMRSARYGRMRFGRCMREDHGSVGCSADVMPQLDRKCSGRTTCHVTIPDASLHNIHPCPRELMPYLEASYVCMPVRTWISTICDWMGDPPLAPGQSSFVTSVGPSELASSSPDCPWTVRVQSGQRLNLTVHFGSTVAPGLGADDAASTGNAGGAEGGLPCSTLSVVVLDGNRTVTLAPPCGADRHRDRQTYSSTGSELRVYAVVAVNQEDGDATAIGATLPGFLLHFHAFGCADISGLSQASISRTGDTTVIRCNLSGETYFLTCKDSTWKGELHNCTKAGVVGAFQSSSTYTYGLLVVIGVGVSLGVAIGVVMLFAIVVCLRRNQIDRRPSKLRSSQSTTENPLLARYRDMSSLDQHGIDACTDVDRVYSCGIASYSRSFPPTPSSFDAAADGSAPTRWTSSYEDAIVDQLLQQPHDPDDREQGPAGLAGLPPIRGRLVCTHHRTHHALSPTAAAADSDNAFSSGPLSTPPISCLSELLHHRQDVDVPLGNNTGSNAAANGMRLLAGCACTGCQQRNLPGGHPHVSSSPIYIKPTATSTTGAPCCGCHAPQSSRPASIDLLQRGLTDSAGTRAGGGKRAGEGNSGRGRSRSASRLGTTATPDQSQGVPPTDYSCSTLPAAAPQSTTSSNRQQTRRQKVDANPPDFIANHHRPSASSSVSASRQPCRSNVTVIT